MPHGGRLPLARAIAEPARAYEGLGRRPSTRFGAGWTNPPRADAPKMLLTRRNDDNAPHHSGP
jgi:hypothetical protein